MIKNLIRFILLSIMIVALLCLSRADFPHLETYARLDKSMNTRDDYKPMHTQDRYKNLKKWLQEDGSEMYKTTSTKISDLQVI